MKRRSYPSDLKEMQWAVLSSLILPAKLGKYLQTTNGSGILRDHVSYFLNGGDLLAGHFSGWMNFCCKTFKY